MSNFSQAKRSFLTLCCGIESFQFDTHGYFSLNSLSIDLLYHKRDFKNWSVIYSDSTLYWEVFIQYVCNVYWCIHSGFFWRAEINVSVSESLCVSIQEFEEAFNQLDRPVMPLLVPYEAHFDGQRHSYCVNSLKLSELFISNIDRY